MGGSPAHASVNGCGRKYLSNRQQHDEVAAEVDTNGSINGECGQAGASAWLVHAFVISTAPEISVVVPLRNEAPNVRPLAEAIFGALGNAPHGLELILVDDGSTDGTWEQILTVRGGEPRIRSIRHLKGAGQSAALWTGFRASRGRIIATLDGDLQNKPSDLPRLVDELKGVDLVCGVRVGRQDTAVRRFSSTVARKARKLVLGVDFRDTGCNLRVFNKSVLEPLPAFDGFHRFMPILVHGAGGQVKEVEVTHAPRVAGKSKYGIYNRLGRGICDLLMVALLQRRQFKQVKAAEEAPGAEK